jgi:hypothetical protein
MDPDPESQKINCSICSLPLTLLQPDTCTDEKGIAVHSDCYVRSVAPDRPAEDVVAA